MYRITNNLRESKEYLSVFKLILRIDGYLKVLRQCAKATQQPLLGIIGITEHKA